MLIECSCYASLDSSTVIHVRITTKKTEDAAQMLFSISTHFHTPHFPPLFPSRPVPADFTLLIQHSTPQNQRG